MKALNWIATILVVIGGLNWGLIGFFDWNLVSAIFGESVVATIVYDLVGISALWMLLKMFTDKNCCKES